MSDTFDPFTATLEQALAMPDEPTQNPRGPVRQWCAAQDLMTDRKLYEANPLIGIALCCSHGLAVPDWLTEAYLRGYYAKRHFKVKTWDEAFPLVTPEGVNPNDERLYYLPKGRHLDTVQSEMCYILPVAMAVEGKLRDSPDQALDEGFFEEVGKSLEGVTLPNGTQLERISAATADKLAHRAWEIGLAVKPRTTRKRPRKDGHRAQRDPARKKIHYGLNEVSEAMRRWRK